MVAPRLPLATAVLVALNVGVWLLQVAAGVPPLHPPAQSLIAWGGDVPLLTLTGDTWRLATAMFLHGGAAHLAMNMLALAFTATRLEDEYGTARMLVVYVLGGILASCATVRFNEHDPLGLITVSVGASGAIMAQFGALLTALVIVPPGFAGLPPDKRPGVDQGLIQVVVINIALGFIVPHVDQAAHVGGLVSGMVLGALMAVAPRADSPRAALARYGAAALLTTLCVGALLHGANSPHLLALRAQWTWQQEPAR
jgi:rhomboid protease GluP